MNDLTTLATTINEHHQQAQGHAKSAIEHALACGDALLIAKQSVKHGEWLPWLKDNTIISERTASGYMRVASNRDQLKSATVADLTLRGALQALSTPKLSHPIYEHMSDDEAERLELYMKSRVNCPDEVEDLHDYYRKCLDLASRYRDWLMACHYYREELPDDHPDKNRKSLMTTYATDPNAYGDGAAEIEACRSDWLIGCMEHMMKYAKAVPNLMTEAGLFIMTGKQFMVTYCIMRDHRIPNNDFVD